MTLPFLQGGPGTPTPTVPLVGPSDTEVSTLEDADDPVTYTASALVDKWGLYWMVGEEGAESEAGSEGAVGLTGSLQTVAMSGLRNADFTTPPPFPDEYLDDTNPLPGWTFVRDEGGSINARWVVDSAAPGGYAIQWETTPAAAGDSAYFEQIAPAMPRAWPTMVPMATCEDNGHYLQYITAQYLRYDGTVTGTEVLAGQGSGLSDAENLVAIIVVPTDARYLRFRFGVRGLNALATTTNMREVYAGAPCIVYTTVAFSSTTLTAGGTQALYSVSGNVTGDPDNIVNRYIAPRAGWVHAVSVVGHQLLTAGSAKYRVRDETASLTIGPTATLNTTSTARGTGSLAYAVGTYHASNNAFAAGAALRGIATASSNISNAGMDSLMHVTLALVEPFNFDALEAAEA